MNERPNKIESLAALLDCSSISDEEWQDIRPTIQGLLAYWEGREINNDDEG